MVKDLIIMDLVTYYDTKKVYQKVSRGRLDGVLKLMGNLSGKLILDIGCGAGEMGDELKHNGAALVHGLDIASTAALSASKVLDGTAVFNLETDTTWPALVENKNYDFIILSEVLEHLFKPEDALQKIKNKFKSDIIITVPNVLFWKNRLKILAGYFTYTNTGLMDRGHIHFFSWDSLQQTIKDGGYQITETAHHVPTRGTSWLAKFWPGLFSYQFIVRLEITA